MRGLRDRPFAVTRESWALEFKVRICTSQRLDLKGAVRDRRWVTRQSRGGQCCDLRVDTRSGVDRHAHDVKVVLRQHSRALLSQIVSRVFANIKTGTKSLYPHPVPISHQPRNIHSQTLSMGFPDPLNIRPNMSSDTGIFNTSPVNSTVVFLLSIPEVPSNT